MKLYNDKEILKSWEIIQSIKKEFPKDIDQMTYNNLLTILNNLLIKNKLRKN